MPTDRKTPIVSHRKTVDYTYTLFRLIGIWNWEMKNPIVNVFNSFIRQFNWFVVIFIQVFMVADMLQNLTNIEAVSDVIGFLAPLSVTTMKSIKIHILQKKMHLLIESVYKPIEFMKYSSDVGVLKTIRTAIYLQNFESILFASILVMVACITIIMGSVLNDTGLPMRGTFPFDETKSLAFKIVFFLQFWTLLISCITVGLFDLLLLGMIRWINVQITILQNNYRSCEPASTKRDSFFMSEDTYKHIENYSYFKVKEEDYDIKVFVPFRNEEIEIVNDSFVLRLKTCINHHKRILDCINTFNDTFSFTLCIQIITSNAVMCFYLYQAAWAIKYNKNIIKCLIMFLAVITELFYYCIYGTLLAIEGEALRESQFNSSWYDYLSREVGDLLINSLILSIKPMEMRAGYFFIFSVETFVSVLRRAYSFFAILNTMMN